MPNPALAKPCPQSVLERPTAWPASSPSKLGSAGIEAPSACGHGDRWPYTHALEIVRTMPIAKHVLPCHAQNRILHLNGEAQNVHWRLRTFGDQGNAPLR